MKRRCMIVCNFILFCSFSLLAEIPNNLKIVQENLLKISDGKSNRVINRNLGDDKVCSSEIILADADGVDFVNFYYVSNKETNSMFPISIKAKTHEVSRIGAIVSDLPMIKTQSSDLVLLESFDQLWQKIYIYSEQTNITTANAVVITIDLAKSDEKKMRKIIEVIQPLLKTKIKLEENLLERSGSLANVLSDHIKTLNSKYSDALWSAFCSNGFPSKTIKFDLKSDDFMKMKKCNNFVMISKNNGTAFVGFLDKQNPKDFFYKKNQIKSWVNGLLFPFLEYNVGKEINGKVFITKTLDSNVNSCVKDNSYLMVFGEDSVAILQNMNMSAEDFKSVCEKISGEKLDNIWNESEVKDLSNYILQSFLLKNSQESVSNKNCSKLSDFVFEKNSYKFELGRVVPIERMLKSRNKKSRMELFNQLKDATAGQIIINKGEQRVGDVILILGGKNGMMPLLGQIANYYFMDIGYINNFFAHFKACQIDNWHGVINTEKQIDKKFYSLNVPGKDDFFQDVKLIIGNGTTSMLISAEDEKSALEIGQILIQQVNK